MTKLHLKRFAELASEAQAIAASEYDSGGISSYVDNDLFTQWKIKTLTLLSAACGPESEHYRFFVSSQKAVSGDTTLSIFKRLRSCFVAARDDYEGGHLTSVRTLVQAEIFDTELEQASELLDKGFKVPAAVIAGTVLETTLRELCDRNELPHGMIGKMNDSLAKAGAYTSLMQKRITTMAQIRNDAAHGKPDQFNDADVKTMIADVERFLTDYLS